MRGRHARPFWVGADVALFWTRTVTRPCPADKGGEAAVRIVERLDPVSAPEPVREPTPSMFPVVGSIVMRLSAIPFIIPVLAAGTYPGTSVDVAVTVWAKSCWGGLMLRTEPRMPPRSRTASEAQRRNGF